jgi:ABC-type sugar transport system ATPase subunit
MTMGDRIAVMNQGRLEQAGTPEDVYERPANRFVAGFIGSPAMSFAPVTAADGDLRGEGFRVAGGADGRAQGELVLGIRPEHVRPWRDGAELVGPIEGTVAYVEALGRETFLGVDAAGGSRFVVTVEGRAGEQPGDRLRFGFVPAGLRLFEAESGAAVPLPERAR